MPDVSVILNSFNQVEFLGEAVQSVLDQSHGNFELILIDNGSTDGSRDLIRTFSDPRIRAVLHDENRPITVRFNEAVRIAEAPLISFLYSDDLYFPRKLEIQISTFRGLPDDYGVVYGRAMGWNIVTGKRWEFGSIGRSGMIFEEMMSRHFSGQIDMISPMIRRRCLLDNPFYEDIFAEGEGVLFRIALDYKFRFIDEPFVILRDHERNAGKAINKQVEMTMLMLDRLIVNPKLGQLRRRNVVRFRARLLRAYAWQGARLGMDTRWIHQRLAEAARLDRHALWSPRAAGAFALSIVPHGARRGVNWLGTKIRRNPSNSVLVKKFEGAEQ